MSVFIPGSVPVRLQDKARRLVEDVDVFARKSLNALARNRGVIVIPAWWHVVRLLNVVFPSLGVAVARRELRRLAPLVQKAPAAARDPSEDGSS